MGKIARFLEKTDGLLLRCLGLSGSPDTDREPIRTSQNILESCGDSSWPWDTVSVHDRSFSMSHKDWPPSRLAAGQKALERYVRTRAAISPADRVAVVSFDTEASTDVPLTSVNNRNSIIKAAMKLKANGGTDIAVGLEAAVTVLANPLVGTTERRLQKILLLTDGKGGRPLSIAEAAKSRGITIDVVGIGGKPSAVDEPLLRKVATTDADGHNHYQFIGDSADLTEYYQHLATSLVWRHDSE